MVIYIQHRSSPLFVSQERRFGFRLNKIFLVYTRMTQASTDEMMTCPPEAFFLPLFILFPGPFKYMDRVGVVLPLQYYKYCLESDLN
jgi:hypothetical protein